MKTSYVQKIILLFIVWLMILVTNKLSGQDIEITEVGKWGEGPCFAVEQKDNIAFYGNGSILEIEDLSDPENPIHLASYQSSGSIEDIAIEGNTAYIGSAGKGLSILDISTPSSPVQLGFFAINSYYINLLVDGDLVYYHTGSTKDFNIIDVSSRTHPILLSSTEIGRDGGIAKSGNYVFLSASNRGMAIVDVSDPENPMVVARNEDYYSYDIDIEGNYVYLCAGSKGVQIFDISSPSDPQNVGHIEIPSSWYVSNCTVKNNTAYLSLGKRFMIFDVSDPGDPVLMADMQNTLEDCSQTILLDDNLLVADAHNGVTIIDAADLENPVSLGTLKAAGLSLGIAEKDDITYVANGYGGVRSFDISDPDSPVPLDQIDSKGNAYDIIISDDYAYVAITYDGLLILDISNPADMMEVKRIPTGTHEGIFALKKKDNVLFLAQGGDAMRIFDVSDPGNPEEIGSVTTEGRSFDVDVKDNIACLANWDSGIRIIDISDLSQPVEIGHLDGIGKIESVTINGNYAYVGVSSSGIRVVDISDPTNPLVVGEYFTGRAYQILVNNQIIYVSAGTRGIVILDVSDPTNPQEIGSYDTDGEVYDITLSDDHLYLADNSTGMKILRYDETSSVKDNSTSINMDHLSPNPFYYHVNISFHLKSTDYITISILDVNGRLIRYLSEEKKMAGDHLVSWDGTGLSGQRVRSGYYLVEISGAEVRLTQPVIFVNE